MSEMIAAGETVATRRPDDTKRISMRSLFGAVCAILFAVSLAQAAEAEGEIRSIDRDALTITLSDGNSYKLPGEFDLESLSEGMDVLLAYETVDGQNLITDMQLPE
jgi:Cu/Ag efflux protein CusF